MGQKEERKMATSVFARGRGRGRGITPHQPLRRPGETFEQKSETTVATSSNGKAEEKSDLRVESLTKAIDELRFKSSDESFAGVTSQAKEFATTDDKLKQIVDHLTQRCKADSEFAATAVAVGDRLCKLDEIGPKFRGCLLKAAQENYKNREVIKTKSVTEWLGVVCFICEIFKVLRINEAPLKPLAGPLYVMLAELLKGENAEEIDCFNMQFRDIGKLLESVSEAKMAELLRDLRDTIVKHETSARSRCLLLEMMELKSLNWAMSKDVEQYYADTLADLMAQES